MGYTPTPAQLQAIKTKGKSVLLSAAAGSGKTATLTNRIIESLTDPDSPADLSRMLIVTFTRAAAAELRERISTALSKALEADPTNKHLNRQTVVIGSAEICTIDAFCLELVKSEFQHLTLPNGQPLPPDFRLGNDAELKTLRLSVMNSVIDKWYEKISDRLLFPRLVESFSTTRGEGSLVETLISYTEFLSSQQSPQSFTPDFADYYQNIASQDFFKSKHGAVVREFAIGKLEYFRQIMADAVTEFSDGTVAETKYLPCFKYNLNFCNESLDALEKSYAEARQVILGFNTVALSSLGKKRADQTSANFKLMRDRFNEQMADFKEKYFSLTDDEINAISLRTSEDIRTLGEVVSDYLEEYTKEKLSRRILEFSDITRLAHSLLVDPDGNPSPTALELRRRFDAVYIDEYQDVNRIQDDIFRAVSRDGCRFVVGDIKQSIYMFRGAEPSIFGKLRQVMPKHGTPEADRQLACSIFMSENFRCDEPVIDFVNLVSRYTFVPTGGMIGYKPAEDNLIFKKSGGSDNKVKAVFLKAKNVEESYEAETEYISREILNLLKNGKKNDGSPITPSDIAVLSRGNDFCAEMSKKLSKYGIECANSSAEDFFGNPEILLVLSLVATIDNPQKDIPLAGALRSPFFGFSMDELVRLRLYADSSRSLYESVALVADEGSGELSVKCAGFCEKLFELRNDARNLPVDRFVGQLYRDFGIMSLISQNDYRTPAAISANLRRFYEYAREYTKTSNGGLSGFVRFINGIIETNGKVDAPGVAASGGSVSVMTIHKSKGLEFPVVFVAACGKNFSTRSLMKPLLWSEKLGVALKLSDNTGFAATDTVFRRTVALDEKQKNVEEEMRVLYVALTRARERLYTLSSIPLAADTESLLFSAAFEQKYACRSSVLSATSYTDWLLPTLNKTDSSFEIVEPSESLEEMPTPERRNTVDSTVNSDEYVSLLNERFLFEYPRTAALKLPAKLSVSRLYPEVLDDDSSATLDGIELAELREKPLFMQESAERHTAAERGTATHLFLQFCDFSAAAKDLRSELARLVTERFIPAGVADIVNIKQLKAFFVSDIYKSLSNVRTLYREQRFNLLLPASEFTAQDELADSLKDEKLLVQGVIDLVFIDSNGNIVLCDYKTDYLTPNELIDDRLAAKKLAERHGQQLKYYSAAVRELFGRNPDRVCIYSLPLGKSLDIPVV